MTAPKVGVHGAVSHKMARKLAAAAQTRLAGAAVNARRGQRSQAQH